MGKQKTNTSKNESDRIQAEKLQIKENHKFIHEYYKKLDLWTLNEGLALVSGPFIINPMNPNPTFPLFNTTINFLDIRFVKRAIESGSLKVNGYDKEKVDNYKGDNYQFDPKAVSELHDSDLFSEFYYNPLSQMKLFRKIVPPKINYWVDCFGELTVNPFEFLEFVKEKELYEISPYIQFIKKTSESGEIQYFWASNVQEDVKEQQENTSLDPRSTKFEYIQAYRDTAESDFFDYIEKDPERQHLEYKIYEGMKKLDLWTLDEGIMLLYSPENVHRDMPVEEYVDKFLNRLELQLLPLERAVEAEKLKVIGFKKDKNQGWVGSFGHCKVSPFEFLEFIKERDLFKIPPEFDFLKQTLISGEIEYSWANSDAEKTRAKDTERLAKYYDPEIHDEEPSFTTPIDLEKIERKIFEEMKKLDLWTLSEGICLLTSPHYIDDPGFDYYIQEILLDLDLKPYIRAIQAGTLKVIGFDKTKKLYRSVSYGKLKISPFDFLEFIKRKDLLKIPIGLDYIKKTSESGGAQYFWESDDKKDADPVAKEDQCLENGSQNTITQSKTSDFEINDRNHTNTQQNDDGGKKLRPDRKDKIECKRIASQIWQEYGILDIVHLIKHPDIKKLLGSLYKETTIHKWLSEIAPENAKKRGKRPKETREEQKKICNKIGIKI